MNKIVVLMVLVCAVFTQTSYAEEEQLPYPNMAASIGVMLERFYYDHDRIQPALMVKRALRAIETAEMSVDLEWDEKQIKFNFNGEKITIDANVPSSLTDVMMLFKNMQSIIMDRPEYEDKIRSAMVYAMYNGALQTLDPHTLLFPPKPASRFTDELEGEFFGIGAYLSQEDGVVKIDRVMPGRPAEKAGIRNGDKIVRVDGEKTAGLSLSESVTRIKGPRGTKVVLTIEREGKEEPFDITVIRDLVRIEVLQAYRKGDIAYVRLDEFNKNADKMLRDVLYKWERDTKNPVMGLVLDLRFNGGGRLDKAKIISDLFLAADKEIVRTVSKGRKPQSQYSNQNNITILDVPMLVLVSESSASAAEILAGSLQQNNRAVILGNTSYGKGSVQQYRPLQNKSIFKFTVQEYQLKDGISIQGTGIVPDVKLVRHMVDEDGKVDIVPFSRSSEADAEFALKSHDNYKHNTTHEMCWVAEYESLESLRNHYISAGEKFTPDQEAQLAIDVLSQAMSTERADELLSNEDGTDNFGKITLELIKSAIEERQVQEAEDLAAALKDYGAIESWGTSASAKPNQLALKYTGPQSLQVGAKEELTFEVENNSDEMVGCLFAVIRRDREDGASPFWEEEILFGEAPAHGSVKGSMAFSVPPRLYAGEERFVVDLYQHRHHTPITSTTVKVKIANKRRPHFNFSWSIDAADGRLLMDRQETLTVKVRNDGNEASAPVTILMSKKDNRFIQLTEGRWKLASLPPQGEHIVKVPFIVNSELALRTKTLKNDQKNIELDLFVEERFDEDGVSQYRESLSFNFELPLNVELKGGKLQKPNMILKEAELVDDRLLITVDVDDENLEFVTAFHEKDKVALRTADELEHGVFKTSIAVRKGLNQIQVVCRDEDQLLKYLPIRYWSDVGIEDPQPTAALPNVEDEEAEDIP